MRPSWKMQMMIWSAKTLDDLLNNPGENLTYQDYASDIREILAYKRGHSTKIL